MNSKIKEIVNDSSSEKSNDDTQIQKGSLKRSFMSCRSIFSDMNLNTLIRQAFKHPTIERQTKLSLDFVENQTAYLSEIMNTCNGRDKMC